MVLWRREQAREDGRVAGLFRNEGADEVEVANTWVGIDSPSFVADRVNMFDHFGRRDAAFCQQGVSFWGEVLEGRRVIAVVEGPLG